MTESSATASATFTGSGIAGPFPFSFKIFSDDELRVYKTVIATGVQALLTLTTDYTVSGAGNDVGGSITLVDAISSAYSLNIQTSPAIEQQTDIRNETGFFPDTIEDQFDRCIAIDKKQQVEINRSLKVPQGEAAPAVLPAKVARANTNAYFDSNGDLGAGAVSLAGANVSAMASTVSAASLISARANMGVPGITFINVKDSPYLAVGDGVTDDTVAIRAAYTVASSGNHNLYFPRGTYLMNGDNSYDETLFGNLYVSTKTNFTLFGDGPGASVIKQGHSTRGGIKFSGCVACTLRDIRIDQNGNQGFGVDFGGSYMTMSNVDIRNVVHNRGVDSDQKGIALVIGASTLCHYNNINIDTVSNGIYCGYSASAPTAAPNQYNYFTDITINNVTDAFGVKLRYSTEAVFDNLYLEEARCAYLIIESGSGCRFNNFSCETAPTGAVMTDTAYVYMSASKNIAFNGVFWHQGATSLTGRDLFDLGATIDGFAVRDMHILANQSIAEVFRVSAVSAYASNVVIENLSITIAGGKTVTAITTGFFASFSGYALAGANCKANGSQIQVLNCLCDVYVTTGSNKSIYATVGSGAIIYADTVAQTGCTRYVYDDTAAADSTPTTIFAGVHPLSVPSIKVGANQVLGARATGWTVATGTANRTTFDTATVTTALLAQRFMALEQDLITHGIIGT